MDSQTGFIFKVFILSTGLSVFIKYGGRVLPIAPTQTNALVAIALPSLILAFCLWWRDRKNQPLN
ncbi:MAG: hypothetical protein F6K10_19400 [Moorea sp. SIO2B7]|nr:hypothetical protein [Moorena sp. SIO2B7]